MLPVLVGSTGTLYNVTVSALPTLGIDTTKANKPLYNAAGRVASTSPAAFECQATL